MSMETELVTTPPPNYGWGGSGSGGWGIGSSMVKPKSGKSAASTGLVDNNAWLHPSGGNVWDGHVGSSSKSSKSIGVIAVPINSQVINEEAIINVPNGIKVTSKTGKAAYSNAQDMWVSKSSKSVAMMSYPSQEEAIGGIKVTSKTGKGSYYASDGQIIMVSKSAKSEFVMSISNQGIIAVPNGIKVDSKTGKASYLSDGQVMMSSKSAKSDLMSYQYLGEGAISGVKVTAKTSKKSSKSAKTGMYPETKSIKIESANGQHINLFEVKAFSLDDVNVALDGAASQSSTYQSFVASAAVDGDEATTFSHTGLDDTDPWWQVDFASSSSLKSVEIKNKHCDTDPVCLCRLTGATVSFINEIGEVIGTKTLGDTCEVSDISIDVSSSIPNTWVNVATKSEKSAHLMSVNYSTVDPSYIASKSAKSLSDTNTGVKVTTKTGKSAYLMSIDHSEEHPMAVSKSSKGTKSISNLSMDTGEVWLVSKSAKSLSKSSKSTIEQDTIIITPEEAGLPFRAKSSKSIPLRQVHNNMNMPTESSMPIQVSSSSNLSKRVQLQKEAIVQQDGTTLTLDEYKKEAIVQEDEATMTLAEYNDMYRPPKRKSAAEMTLIQWSCVVTSFVVVGYLM
ncbi:hypothetical protein ACHAXN_006418 [Cyclotella atomus]